MLIEVLVAILVLTFGILGIVGLQAKMTVNMNDARFRAEAAFLADQLIGLMWSDAHGGLDNTGINNLINYKMNESAALDACTDFTNTPPSSVAPLVAWFGAANTPGTVLNLLPNGRARVAINAEQVVSVQLCWQSPNDIDTAGNPIWHHHEVRTRIRG